jgi:hypothetical protein
MRALPCVCRRIAVGLSRDDDQARDLDATLLEQGTDERVSLTEHFLQDWAESAELSISKNEISRSQKIASIETVRSGSSLMLEEAFTGYPSLHGCQHLGAQLAIEIGDFTGSDVLQPSACIDETSLARCWSAMVSDLPWSRCGKLAADEWGRRAVPLLGGLCGKGKSRLCLAARRRCALSNSKLEI